MTLQLELGQVSDPSARRALEQISLRWPLNGIPPAGGLAGYYSSATHAAGSTLSIPRATHGLRATRGLVVQALDEATGLMVAPDVRIGATGDVTLTFASPVAANSVRVTITGPLA